MSRSSDTPRRSVGGLNLLGFVLLFCFVGIGVGFHLCVRAGVPDPQRVLLVPDDAYYYFRIAENRSLHGEWSFDGENPTTGFQLAYAALLWLGYSTMLPSHYGLPVLASGVCTVCLLTSSVVIYLAGARWLSKRASILLAAMWLALPYNVMTTLTCMESALVLLVSALLLLIWSERLRARERSAPAGRRLLAAAAACSALAVLSRTDLVFLSASIALADWISTPSRNDEPKNAWSAMRRLLLKDRFALALAGGSILGVLILMTFCYSTTGRLVQDSGSMKMLWSTHSGRSGWDRFEHTLTMWNWNTCQMLASPAGHLDWTFRENRRLRGLVNFAFVALACVSAAVFVRRRQKAGRDSTFAVAAVLHMLMHSVFISWFLVHAQAHWYFAGVQCSFLMISLAAVRYLGRRWPRPSVSQAAVWASVAALLLSGVVYVARSDSPANADCPFEHQADFYNAAVVIDERLPPDARIGAWNAGILGFYSGRKVINLDGVVNSAIRPYAERREVRQYVQDARIGWIADHEAQFRDVYQMPLFAPTNDDAVNWLGSHLRLEFRVRTRLPSDSYYGGYCVWRVVQ